MIKLLRFDILYEEDGKGCEIIDLKDKKWNKLLISIKDDSLIDTDTSTRR